MDCNSRAHVPNSSGASEAAGGSLVGVMDVASRPQQRLLHSCLSRWKDEEKKLSCRVRGDAEWAPWVCVLRFLSPPRFQDSHLSAQHCRTYRHFRLGPRPLARRCSVSRSTILSRAATRLPPLPWRPLYRSPRPSTWSVTCLGQMPASTGALSPAASVAKSGRSLAGPAARGELALAGRGPRGPPPLTFPLRPRPALAGLLAGGPGGPAPLTARLSLPVLRALSGRCSRPWAVSPVCSGRVVTFISLFPPL